MTFRPQSLEGVAHDARHGLAGNALKLLTVLEGVFLQEILDEVGNVAPMLAERRYGHAPRSFHAVVRSARNLPNRDLESEVRLGRFRADLYYRVNVVPVSMPPLRDHRGDIPYLVEYFIKKYFVEEPQAGQGHHRRGHGQRSCAITFPGNVRELENVIERGVVLCRGEYLTENDIFLPRGGRG